MIDLKEHKIGMEKNRAATEAIVTYGTNKIRLKINETH
jgi:hypothetical protein